MSYLPKVKLVTSNGITKIFIDDVELKGCTHAELKWQVESIPTIDLVLLSDDVVVETDKADLIKWVEVNPDENRSE